MVARSRRQPLARKSIEDNTLRLRFGGGLNTIADPTDIQDEECVSGFNYLLTPGNKTMHARGGVQKVYQAANNAAIVGFASLQTVAGVTTLLLQAGNTVYNWNGTNAANVGTVNANARLRGVANWALTSDKCIITDLALVETVKEWNGSTFTTVSFTKDNGNAFGSFKAKYCTIHEERVLYGNVVDAANVALPHVLVGSKRGDYKEISTSNRASSSIGAADPFYLPTPNLKPICGLVSAFGQLAIATFRGDIYNLEGSSPADFIINTLYASPMIESYEAFVSTGNDIVFGSISSIESLSGVQNYGDVEKDDLSLWIKPDVEDVREWRIVFNARYKLLYCFPISVGICYVMSTTLYDSGLSPWMAWKTDAEHDFQPQVVFAAPRPVDGRIATYLTDDSGGLYEVGTEALYDSKSDDFTTTIQVSRVSKTWALPIDNTAYYLDGSVEYVPTANGPLTIHSVFSGSFNTQHATQLDLKGDSDGWYFGGNYYFGGEIYFSGTTTTRYVRQSFEASGQSDMLSIRLESLASGASIINAINYRFEEVD